MSNIELVELLCEMLGCAQEIIRRQATILAQHGIDCTVSDCARLVSDIERWV